jgi:hypothetical protein
VRTALCLCALAATIAVPAAAGDGSPSPGVMQGGEGIVSRSGAVRYVTLPTETATVLEVVRVRGGVVQTFRIFKGHYGIPFVTNSGDTGGLSQDGTQLVLSDAVCCGLRKVSRFLVFQTKRLRRVQRIVLRGDFSYDALSPDAGTLYLIQHTSARDYTRYRVRAYDVGAKRLLPKVIADREEPKEVMRGYPAARATSADGGWVYTLYAGGKMPFVHALDTRHREALCLDLPWAGSQDPLWSMRLRLSSDEKKLLVVRPSGRQVMKIDVPG